MPHCVHGFKHRPDKEGIKTPFSGADSLIKKGLRPWISFKHRPDKEGIKTPLQSGFRSNTDLIKKGLILRFLGSNTDLIKKGLNTDLIKKGLRHIHCAVIDAVDVQTQT
jgi:hypothetical protein